MSGATRFAASPLDLRIRDAFGISRWTREETLNILVRVECEGIVGVGEGAPNARYGESQSRALEDLQTLFDAGVAGLALRTVSSVEALAEALEAPRRQLSSLAAASALDMACHDWLGKRQEKRLCELWGEDPRLGPESAFTIGIDAPEVVARKVREAQAYPLLKVKLGSDHDAEILAAVRSVTDKALWVDANEGWPRAEEALRHIRALVPLGVHLVEQPIPSGQPEEMRWLKARSPLPLFADEDLHADVDVAELAAGYHGVNIKLDKLGGLGPARRVIDEARGAGLQVMVGCMIASSLALSAAAHLSLSADLADLDGHLLLAQDPFIGLRLEGGRVILPEGAGIGALPRQAGAPAAG